MRRPRPERDRLLALVIDEGDSRFENLFEIDPDHGFVYDLGFLTTGVGNGFQGLAYDSVNDKLYASGFGESGLYEIDYSCPALWCTTTQVPDIAARSNSSLAYSEETGRLYLSGSQSGPRTLFDSIDATTFEVFSPIGIDDYTPGGLAAIPVPVPEPHPLIFQVVGGLSVAGLARRRRLRRTRA